METRFSNDHEKEECIKALREIIDWMDPEKERHYLLTVATRERLKREANNAILIYYRHRAYRIARMIYPTLMSAELFAISHAGRCVVSTPSGPVKVTTRQNINVISFAWWFGGKRISRDRAAELVGDK